MEQPVSTIGVVIPVLNQYKLAIDCIAHLRSRHRLETFIIPQYRNQIPLSAAWNQGIEEAFRKKHNQVVVLNDDVLLSPWAIDEMLSTLFSDSQIAVVTATNARGLLSPDDVLTLERPTDDDRSKPLQPNPDFACFMLDQMTYSVVGPFDDGFMPAYFEDNDYHRRINLAGLSAGSVASAIMYHYGSQTQNANPNAPIVPSAAFRANRQRYVEKWGGEPGKETYATPFNR